MLNICKHAESCSHLTNQRITETLLVNSQDGFSWPCHAFKSLLLLWISASVIETCQDVSSSHPGKHFGDESVQGSLFLQD